MYNNRIDYRQNAPRKFRSALKLSFTRCCFCLTETWLHDSVSGIGDFAGHPYTVVLRSDRTAGHHGRLLVAMSKLPLIIQIKSVNLLLLIIYFSKCEQVYALVLSNQILSLCIILAYLPPRGSDVKPVVTEDKLRSILLIWRQA